MNPPAATAGLRHGHFAYPDPQTLGYAEARPFAHAVLRDAWSADLVAGCKQSIRGFTPWGGAKNFFGAKHKRFCRDPEVLPEPVFKVIQEAGSPRFLRWLEQLTGEACLLPDPYLEGGGIHQIGPGGFLKVHADFNWHPRLRLYRRLNVLLYLNDGWRPEWGGALELWQPDMSACVRSVLPEANTMVVFTTDDQSFHGHPRPLACPADVTRDSIALYYYSPLKPARHFAAPRESTDYRPIEGDDFAAR